MVFAFKSDRDAHCQLTAGNIATGNVLGDTPMLSIFTLTIRTKKQSSTGPETSTSS
jgi:hypothetical protein